MKLDHLVYAVPDLDAAVGDFAARTGVTPSAGGKHEGLGTYNALVALGGGAYLEIIGPDPSQPPPAGPKPFGIDDLASPRLVTWAVATTSLDSDVARARENGYDPGETIALSRARPDGVLLEWRVVAQLEPAHGGLVPFLIDWGTCPHPSESAASGVTLLSLRGEHPRAGEVSSSLRALGAELDVEAGDAPALTARLSTPRGEVELR